MSGRIKGPGDVGGLSDALQRLMADALQGKKVLPPSSYDPASAYAAQKAVKNSAGSGPIIIQAPDRAAPVHKGSQAKGGAVAALSGHLLAELRRADKGKPDFLISSDYLRIPLPDLIKIFFESGIKDAVARFGPEGQPRLTLKFKFPEDEMSLPQVAIEGLSRDERRANKNAKISLGPEGSIVFNEEGPGLIARHVTEAALRRAVDAVFHPDFPQREDIFRKLRTKAHKNDFFRLDLDLQDLTVQALMPEVPAWIESKKEDWFVRALWRAMNLGGASRAGAFEAVKYHLDGYLSEIRTDHIRQFPSAADLLDNMVKSLRSQAERFIPASWEQFDEITQDHLLEDYIAIKTSQPFFNALICLLVRVFDDLFEDPMTARRVNAYDRLIDEKNPSSEPSIETRLSTAGEMAVQVFTGRKPDKIKAQVFEAQDYPFRMRAYALVVLNRYLDQDDRLWPQVKEKLFCELEQKMDHGNTSLTLQAALADYLLEEQAFVVALRKHPLFKAVLDPSLPDSYRKFNASHIRHNLHAFLKMQAELHEKGIKGLLRDRQVFADLFAASPVGSEDLTALLALPTDDRASLIFDPMARDVREDTGNPERIAKLLLMANDEGYKGHPVHAVPMYDVVRTALEEKGHWVQAGLIILKQMEALQHAYAMEMKWQESHPEAPRAKGGALTQQYRRMAGELALKDLLEETMPKIQMKEADSYYPQATALLSLMECYDEAIKVLNAYLKKLESSENPDVERIGQMQLDKADLFIARGDAKTAQNTYRKILALEGLSEGKILETRERVTQLVAEDRSSVSDAKRAAKEYMELALAQRKSGRHESFVKSLGQAVAIWRDAGDYDAAYAAVAQNGLLDVAAYFKHVAQLFPAGEERDLNMGLFDDCLRHYEALTALTGIDEELEKRKSTLLARRDKWQGSLELRTRHLARDFHQNLHRVAQKFDLNPEDLLKKFHEAPTRASIDIEVANVNLTCHFETPTLVTTKFWNQTKSVLEALGLTAAQVSVFAVKGESGSDVEKITKLIRHVPHGAVVRKRYWVRRMEDGSTPFAKRMYSAASMAGPLPHLAMVR